MADSLRRAGDDDRLTLLRPVGTFGPASVHMGPMKILSINRRATKATSIALPFEADEQAIAASSRKSSRPS